MDALAVEMAKHALEVVGSSDIKGGCSVLVTTSNERNEVSRPTDNRTSSCKGVITDLLHFKLILYALIRQVNSSFDMTKVGPNIRFNPALIKSLFIPPLTLLARPVLKVPLVVIVVRGTHNGLASWRWKIELDHHGWPLRFA